MDFPNWLTAIAWLSLLLGGVSTLIIIVDLAFGPKQHMWIMNLVWPLTALYFGPVAVWAYFSFGRPNGQMRGHRHDQHDMRGRHSNWQSFWLATTHCGSGCVLGDLAAEWLVFAFPFTVLGHKIFGAWVVDYILAFLFGIAFQYFTIKPMKKLAASKALVAAVEADAVSLTAWQVGMFGWMALATFLLFGQELPKTSPIFWFMMQVAMWLGFAVSYPINILLLKAGVKEKM